MDLAARLDLALLHTSPRLRQQDLADRLGVEKAWLSNVKKGRWNGEEKLAMAADMLGVPVDWLVSGTGPSPSWAARDVPDAPAWAIELLCEVKALRADVAELRRQSVQPEHDRRREGVETREDAEQFIAGHARTDTAADELARIMNPDDHPRPKAPTYPRPAAIPGETPYGS